MTKDTTKEAAVAAEVLLFEDWFERSRTGFVLAFAVHETMLEEELAGVLSRRRYGRRKSSEDGEPPAVVGVRHGHRERGLTGHSGRRGLPCRGLG